MHAEIQESSPISVPVHHGPKNGRSKYFIRRSIVASISLILAFLFRDTLCDLIALWAVIIFFCQWENIQTVQSVSLRQPNCLLARRQLRHIRRSLMTDAAHIIYSQSFDASAF